uniref:superoxide dismutase n=1 Tax=viral metagenome TaxID=1070528 RepID=A0A6C0DAG5_9ZZZZ
MLGTSAVAFFQGDINGTVYFFEDYKKDEIKISIKLSGLKPNHKHGFHVHQAGDLTDKCTSMCAHFNPYNKNHGGPNDKERHVGDLGNIETDDKGNVDTIMFDNVIKLYGESNIMGRGLIIHEDTDDLGKGGQSDSLTTGHAGKRIACAVIGYAKENFDIKNTPTNDRYVYKNTECNLS